MEPTRDQLQGWTCPLPPQLPNFSDPRVQMRAEKVLAWAKYCLHPERPRQVSKKTLDRIFSHSGNEVSRWLRSQLLAKVGTHRAGERCCLYLRRDDGLFEVAQRLADAQGSKLKRTISADAGRKLVIHISSGQFLDADELRQLRTKEFDYTVGESSGRFNHPFQNMPREAKHDFWSEWGMHHHYDVSAAAPTLLFQYALKHGMHPKALGAIESYLADKKRWRQHVVDLTGCSYLNAKKIVNSLFNGARLGPNDSQSVFKILGFSRVALDALRRDPLIVYLRSNIRRMWEKLAKNLGRSLSTPKQKWHLYFQLETDVLKVMKSELESQGLKYFTEHDGFTTDCAADLSLVESRVFQVTGFHVSLEEVSRSVEVIDQETGEITIEESENQNASDRPAMWITSTTRDAVMASDLGTKAPDLTMHTLNRVISVSQRPRSP